MRHSTPCCETAGFRSGVASARLGCNAVHIGSCWPTFRDSLLVPSLQDVTDRLTRNVGKPSNISCEQPTTETTSTRSTTRSPFVTCLSRRSQSGRWSSFRKRVWFTESHIVLIISSFFLLVLFTQFIVGKMKKVVLYQVKQLNHVLSK